jgi:hypothetical protein
LASEVPCEVAERLTESSPGLLLLFIEMLLCWGCLLL